MIRLYLFRLLCRHQSKTAYYPKQWGTGIEGCDRCGRKWRVKHGKRINRNRP